jgi:hypothetical protein
VYAESSNCSFFLAFGNQGFALDEHLSKTPPSIGVSMALIKKRDVEKYFADRRTKLRLQRRLARLSDATGFSGSPANSAELNPSNLKTEADQNIDPTTTGPV